MCSCAPPGSANPVPCLPVVTPRSFGLGRCSRADNEVNGVPSCASRELLTELTRSTWNFTGVWVSDCGAVQDVFANHKFAKSPVEAVRDVMDAGLDLNCGEHTLQFLLNHMRDILSTFIFI